MLRSTVKKWIFLFIVIILVLFIALKTGIGFFYFLFWLLVSLVILSLLWVISEYFFTSLSVERIHGQKVKEGDTLDIKINIHSNGVLALFNFVFQDNITCAGTPYQNKPNLLEFLGPGFSTSFSDKCICPQRGRYVIGPLEGYFFDPLGLFYLKKVFKIYSEVYVFPRPFNIQKFPPMVKGVFPWFGIEAARITGEDDEFYGIREYQGGDPIKRIHWLTTARKNKPIVRQFQHQAFYRATLIFNLEEGKNFGKGKDSVCEYMIKIAASVAKYILDKNITLEIIAQAKEAVHFPSNKGKEFLDDVYKFLTLAEAKSKTSLGEVLQEHAQHIPNDTTLIIIMLDRDWDSLQEILPLVKRNIALIPLILVSSTFRYDYEKEAVLKDMQIKMAQSLNFTPILFSKGDNFEEVFLRYQK